MWLLAVIPFVLQAICMLFDEGYFHVRRGLPQWEKIGHPIDTLSVLVCMGIVLLLPFSGKMLTLYCSLAALSCFLVTKDEFVHKEYCPAAENWLHALLFTLHPVMLICAGFIWPVMQGVEVSPWISRWLDAPVQLSLFLKSQFILMSLFLLYQILFWNIIWKNKPVRRL